LADWHIHQIAVTDTSSNVAANLSWLQANLGDISSITLTNVSTPIGVSIAQLENYSSVFDKIVDNYTFAISDTSANIAENLDLLQENIVHIGSITQTGVPAALQIIYAQQVEHATILAKITDSYSLDIVNALATGSVTISGNATQSQVLTASNNLVDLDGLGTITYQWQADGVNISGATTNSFRLGAAQVGKAITVVASYTDILGTDESKTSIATSSVVADTIAPTLISSIPADNDSPVYLSSNLVLSFSEAVYAGSGNIVLTNIANSADTRTIAVTDSSQVSFSGTDVTINPSANLLPGASYAISMASGVILDYASNPYAGISGDTTLNFTAASTANVSGHVYSWKTHVLISDVVVTPSTGSADSSSGGQFDLNNLVVGDYTFNANRTVTNDSAGSAITSADALAALKIAVGINPNSDPDGSGPRLAATLSPYQLMAADVNGDGRVTSADALAILKMAVKLPNAVTPTWIFADESQVFNLSSSNVNYSTTMSKTIGADETLNMVAVLKGDVNGSWGASAAAASRVEYGDPTYFTTLANNLRVAQDVWGIS
jgi:methionine-rich copper-binding protein CopC